MFSPKLYTKISPGGQSLQVATAYQLMFLVPVDARMWQCGYFQLLYLVPSCCQDTTACLPLTAVLGAQLLPGGDNVPTFSCCTWCQLLPGGDNVPTFSCCTWCPVVARKRQCAYLQLLYLVPSCCQDATVCLLSAAVPGAQLLPGSNSVPTFSCCRRRRCKQLPTPSPVHEQMIWFLSQTTRVPTLSCCICGAGSWANVVEARVLKFPMFSSVCMCLEPW